MQREFKSEFKHFKNPPLMEVVAEVKWNLPIQMLSPTSLQISESLKSKDEHLFKNFAEKVAFEGYNLVERLLPPGLPYLPFQPVFRYRKEPASTDTTIYQIGSGIFSANITPPYTSWENFSPIIDRGIESLLSSCQDEAKININSINLRYINAFRAHLIQGKTTNSFITDILGFSINLPKVLQDHVDPSEEIKPMFKFYIPLKSKQYMTIMVGEGKVDEQEAIIMDILVSAVIDSPESVIQREAIMGIFDKGRAAVNTVFSGITTKLHTLMEEV